jgi:Flp pilus assembly protein TadG
MTENLMTASVRKQPIRSRSGQRGATILEFSLSFLLVFTILIAIMEFARFVYSYNILAGATKEAARYAIVHGSKSGSPATEADIRAQVNRWAIGLDRELITVNTTWVPANTPGSRVQIQTTYNIAPMTGLILRAPITLGSRSEMKISQ